jgi:hypothetical protein
MQQRNQRMAEIESMMSKARKELCDLRKAVTDNSK